MSPVIWFITLGIVCELQNGCVFAKVTYCAYNDGSGTKTPPTKAPGFKESARITHNGQVMADNQTIKCMENHDFCYSFWYADQNKTKITIVMQGCWFFPVEDHDCSPRTCLSNTPPNRFPQHHNSKFCCCSGSMCNANISDVYDPELYTTEHPLTPAARHIQDPSYKQRTVIIALVSVCSVALITICIYLLYRICLSNHKPLLDSLNLVEAPPTPSFELEDLKLCNMVSKGRYSDVWRGVLNEEEVAVKIYHSNYRQFYTNEKYIYSLPFIDQENLLQFYGGDERVSQEGTMQYILVLSYVPQGNLMGYLKNNTVDWAAMCKMFYTIARGLSHLHTDITRGDQFKPAIGHRDLNTRNILVKSDLSCVIADFGFAVTMMGSKLLLGGRSENAEQSSLTDVGTLRYMAPELLDGAVNLRDCEASLKQIDIYSLGLVMWEISSRCSALYQGIPVPEYMLPYQAEAGIHPSFDEMQLVVARNKTRPKFPEVWKDTNQAIQALKETIEDCWDQDAEARLTAFCVEERIVEMISLWSQDSKHKGVTPTLIPSNIMSQPGRTDRHTYYDNIGTQTRQKNTSISDSSSPSIPVEGSTIALIINDTHTSMPLQNLSHSRVSWRNENSVSESTAETTIPMSPSDSDLPPKSDNINNARNNAVLPAHQGRNPTVERNTHKRSDEELAISGNTLVINNKLMENGEGTGTSVRDTIATDNLFETVTENLETSLVQNDVLNHHHRNPPIPYVQNHVHSESPLMRPKIANVPGNGSLVPYNRLTVNQAKSHKSRFMKFRPRDIGMKISQLGLFGRSSKHSTNTGQPQPPVAHKYGEKIQNVPNQSLYDPINLNGSAVSRHSVNVNRDGRNPNQAEVEPLLIQTEVRLQNGGPVVRPADLNAASSTQPANRNINFSRDNNSLRYPENRLGIAEVGVAKLEMRQNGYPSVCRIRGGGYSKSTSDLSPEHSCRSSKWKETDLMDVLNSKFHKRPKTLSLRGHNYNRDNKPASSSLTYLSNAANSLDVKLLSNANDDPSEKIKRRVKTPLTMKRGRFSLYDDRLMSHSCDNFAKKANANVTRSSVSLHHIKC